VYILPEGEQLAGYSGGFLKGDVSVTENRKIRPGSLLLLLLVVCVFILARSMNSSGTVAYSDMCRYFREEKVQSFTITGDVLKAKLQDGTLAACTIGSVESFYSDMDGLIQQQVQSGTVQQQDFVHATNWVTTLLPYVMGILGFLLIVRLMGRMNGGAAAQDKMAKFGQARVQMPGRGEDRVTFDQVAGADEEKEELQEIVEFLRDPDKYLQLGAHIPKGVLLVGPPGTGKTLLAKSVAGEADVAFLSISGSDFVEMYVGVGASRVRDLFEQAKKQSPAIVFIDEIDAVGRQRGSGLGGGHDEREQTLNQLLVEMDGFTANSGVVVLAATNRVDILDPALLRPGRFDRQVYVGLPDIKGREEILKVHARNKPLAEDVDLAEIARGTAGFTGADLENLLNEAALLSGRRNEPVIRQKTIQESIIKVIAGPEKHSRVIPEQERKLTAFHEAGHAVVMHDLPGQDPVHQITIVPRGQAGGMTISLPEEDRSYLSKRYMEDEIVALLGGRAAEELMLGDISTGASNDLQRATTIARKMVGTYGMSKRLGHVAFNAGSDEVFIGKSMGHTRPYSEKTAAEMDDEIQQILADGYARCTEILKRQQEKLEAVASFLLEHETMTAEEFESVFQAEKT
jgi:cell division protease FtsH